MSRLPSNLTNAPINLAALRESGKAELLSILDSVSMVILKDWKPLSRSLLAFAPACSEVRAWYLA